MKIHIPELISGRISEILEKTPELVARLASQYSQDAFARKAFDGNPWQQHSDPRRRGSELVRSGNLRGSMRVKIDPDRVTISFGDQRVGYAQVHNEGFDGEVVVPAHTRRTRRGEQQVRAHAAHAHPAAAVRRPGRGARPADTGADRGTGKRTVKQMRR